MTPTMTKQAVNYRLADLFDGKRCGNCVMFRSPGSCTLVQGFISRVGVCDRWAPEMKVVSHART